MITGLKSMTYHGLKVVEDSIAQKPCLQTEVDVLGAPTAHCAIEAAEIFIELFRHCEAATGQVRRLKQTAASPKSAQWHPTLLK